MCIIGAISIKTPADIHSEKFTACAAMDKEHLLYFKPVEAEYNTNE
jgi:hypothetical protein